MDIACQLNLGSTLVCILTPISLYGINYSVGKVKIPNIKLMTEGTDYHRTLLCSDIEPRWESLCHLAEPAPDDHKVIRCNETMKPS